MPVDRVEVLELSSGQVQCLYNSQRNEEETAKEAQPGGNWEETNPRSHRKEVKMVPCVK